MKRIFGIFFSLLLSSCSTSSYLKTIDSKDTSESSTNSDAAIVKTDVKKIEVFCLDPQNKNYKIIGQVLASADAGEDSKTSVDLLKEQAAELGADAIINLHIEFTQGSWSAGILSRGTAIKYVIN